MTQIGRISFAPLTHSTLGFDRFFDDIERLLDLDAAKTVSNFPPHNIIKLFDNVYIVEMDIAGFSKDEIDITVEDGELIIKGEKKEKEVGTYLHKGIGTRSFTKTLHIADTVEVRGAEFKDGILKIGLENIIPEHKKQRKIEICSELMLPKAEKQLLNEDKKVA